jgi:hypothetical protein
MTVVEQLAAGLALPEQLSAACGEPWIPGAPVLRKASPSNEVPIRAGPSASDGAFGRDILCAELSLRSSHDGRAPIADSMAVNSRRTARRNAARTPTFGGHRFLRRMLNSCRQQPTCDDA